MVEREIVPAQLTTLRRARPASQLPQRAKGAFEISGASTHSIRLQNLERLLATVATEGSTRCRCRCEQSAP